LIHGWDSFPGMDGSLRFDGRMNSLHPHGSGQHHGSIPHSHRGSMQRGSKQVPMPAPAWESMSHMQASMNGPPQQPAPWEQMAGLSAAFSGRSSGMWDDPTSMRGNQHRGALTQRQPESVVDTQGTSPASPNSYAPQPNVGAQVVASRGWGSCGAPACNGSDDVGVQADPVGEYMGRSLPKATIDMGWQAPRKPQTLMEPLASGDPMLTWRASQPYPGQQLQPAPPRHVEPPRVISSRTVPIEQHHRPQAAMPTYKVPLEPVAGPSYSLPLGGGDSSYRAASPAPSMSYEMPVATNGSHFRVASPVATANSARTHGHERIITANGARTPGMPGHERIITAPYQLPPSLAAPLDMMPLGSPGGSVRVTPVQTAQTPIKSPCTVHRNIDLMPAYDRSASEPPRVLQVSASFLVPKGSVGPNRAAFDGGALYRALDRNCDGNISPKEVEEYIGVQRRDAMVQAVSPVSHRLSASPRASLRCAASPPLCQSASAKNLAGASVLSDFRPSLTDRSYRLSPANRRATIGGGFSRDRFSRDRSRRNESRDSDSDGCCH